MAEQKRDACSLPQTCSVEPSPAGMVAATDTNRPWGPGLGPSRGSVIAQTVLLMPPTHVWEDGRGQGKEAAKLGSSQGQFCLFCLENALALPA